MKSDIKDCTGLSSNCLATSAVPGSFPGGSFNTVEQFPVLQSSITGAAYLGQLQHEGLYNPDKNYWDGPKRAWPHTNHSYKNVSM